MSTGEAKAARGGYLPVVVATASLLLGLGTGVTPASGQETTRPDTTRIETLDRAGVDRTIALCWDVLRRYPDSEFAPTLMFQLMQLYARAAEMDYSAAMARFEAEQKEYEAGKTSWEPQPPKIDLSRAIDVGETLLQTFPNILFKAKVIYSLALCYSKQGEGDAYLRTLKRLLSECPDDPLVPEVYFRIGEHYFDREQYRESIQAYSKLLQYWESPYFDMGIYKLAWSYFNLGDYSNAISSFVYLIDDLDTVERANPQFMGRTKIDLRQEAIQYIAISFSEYGGVEKAKQFFSGDAQRDWACEVFLRLGLVYFARGDFGEAATAYRTFLALFPRDPRAIDAAVEVVRCQEAAGDVVNADRTREDLLNSFNPGTEWYRGLSSKQRAHADSVLESTFLALGNNLAVAARDTRQSELYQKAIQVYRRYLEFYPRGREADRVRFLMGEVLYESGQLRQAAQAYQECFTLAGDSSYADRAGYNRIFCWDQLRAKAPNLDTTYVQLFDFFGDSVATFRVPNEATAELLRACHEYRKAFPRSEKAPLVMLKLGGALFELGEFRAAERVYQGLFADGVPEGLRAKALAMIGQCRYRMEDYAGTEEWYDLLASSFPDSEQYRTLAARMKASARYKRALQLRESGKAAEAAGMFASAAEASPDDQLAAVSLFEAGTQYEKAGLPDLALQQYDLLCARFPQSQFADESLYRSSLLRESAGDWREAARGYIRLASQYPQSRFARRALFLAGSCLESAGAPDEAAGIYEQYVNRFGPQDPNEYLECLVRWAEIRRHAGDLVAARKLLDHALDSFNRLRINLASVDDYLGAKAQFLIGEILYQGYAAVVLEPPLDRSLRLKQARFTEVLRAYTEAAKYRVAEWTSAATCRIGEAFEEFARALWESPLPPDLTPEQRDTYIRKLAEQVRPFKEKAYEAHRRNLRLAEETGLTNDWIVRSREHLLRLAAELSLPATLGAAEADSGLAEQDEQPLRKPQEKRQ
ncbi:MAG: tetratricopeptide repeat protein [candidate division KSB1 bacterium]|nr:tetratricopeptide repeat protein [candidate division KSB1 bacterium]